MARSTENRGSFLPDFCGARTVFVVILIAELLAIVLTLARTPALDRDRLIDLALYSLFIQWAALSCLAVLCIFRKHLNAFGDIKVGLISYLITQLTTLLVAELAWWTQHFVTPMSGTSMAHYDYLLRVMCISAIVWAMALRYFYVQYQLRKQIVAEADSRYQALQARIKPHFLFNSMNTIASLVRRNPASAEQVVEDLAELFRVTLKEQQKASTLEQELELCRRYLRIEELRLGDRLRVEWRVGDLPGNLELPALILQPLLENAIYHGIERLPEGGVIQLRGEIRPDVVLIHIDNPVTADSGEQAGNRIAQENIRERLAAFFQTADPLRISRDDNHYSVTVTIPRKNEDTHR
ncbi:MAG: histidine kinase [Gammaproteobacteria bacterium]